MTKPYDNHVTKEVGELMREGLRQGNPRTCWKEGCEVKEAEDLFFQYHTSDYHSQQYGVGVRVCPGCHKQLHKNEKRAITMAAKAAKEE